MSVDVDVLLFAAGYGRRLRPLTDNTPKPMVKVCGKPLLEWNLELVAKAGFKKVFINTHYLADQIVDFVGDGSKWGLEIECLYEETLLDTGGTIKELQPKLNHDLLVTLNSDIVWDRSFLISDVVEAHMSNPNNPIATMVLRADDEAENYGALGLAEDGTICSFLNNEISKKPCVGTYMYTGVQVLSREVLDYLPKEESIFSVTKDVHLSAMLDGAVYSGYVYEGYWGEVGNPEALEIVSRHLST